MRYSEAAAPASGFLLQEESFCWANYLVRSAWQKNKTLEGNKRAPEIHAGVKSKSVCLPFMLDAG